MKRPLIAGLLILSCFAACASAQSAIQPGDRIAIVGNTFADQLRIHGYLETMLLQRTRENPVSVRNLGWGGDMLSARDRPTGFASEESTLEAHRTDVIIACFGMGESFDGKEAINEFKSQLRSFIAAHADKSYNGESQVRIVVVSPIAYEDLGRMTPQREKRNQDLEAYSRAMGEVAVEAGIPFVELFSASRYLMDEAAGPSMTTNGIHLNSYGYWAISRAFCDQLISSRSHQPWRLVVDTIAKTGKGQGVNISGISSDGSTVSFRVEEQSAPNLPPPTNADLPPQLEHARDTLLVQNLMPGSYRLTVDGETVATADEQAWGEGVAIDSSPAHKLAEAYRMAVADKNLQFTYSWKALNQVHIVGERKSSPSGRELPKEVIEFDLLAKKRDAALRKGIEFKTRVWKLSRVDL